MGNPFTGVFTAEIDGDSYELAPTFDAMECFIESAGMSEREAFERLAAGKYSSSLIVSAIHAGIMGAHWRSNRKTPSIERRVLGELVMRTGITKFVPIAQKFLLFAIVPYEEAAKAAIESGSEDEAEKKSPT